MQLTVEIPDDVASRLAEAGPDLPRRALEAFALEELRAGHISEVQLRKCSVSHVLSSMGF